MVQFDLKRSKVSVTILHKAEFYTVTGKVLRNSSPMPSIWQLLTENKAV